MSGRVYQYPTGGIFGGRTELPEVMGTGIEFVPNFTGVFGRVLRAVTNLTEEFGRVLTEQNTLYALIRTLPKKPLEICIRDVRFW